MKKIVWILDTLASKFGPVLVLLAPVLIILIIWIYLHILLEQLKYLKILFTSHLMLLILYNFYKSSTTSVKYSVFSHDQEDGYLCSVCHVRKNARIHHCSVCNSCTNRMDHHCPWINNWYCFVLIIIVLDIKIIGTFTCFSCIYQLFV